MLHIALPIGVLLSPLKNNLEKFFLLPTYLASHQAYLNRSGFLTRWDDIGESLQISVALVSVLDNAPSPVAQIAVRCFEPKTTISKVSLLVEADSNYGTYQEIVTLYKVGMKPLIASLRSVPLRAIFVNDQFQFFQSYDTISIKLLKIEPPSSSPIDPCRNAWQRLPTNFDLLNDRFEERWGSYWNMAAVDSEIRELSLWLRYHLVTNNDYAVRSNQLSFGASFINTLLSLIGRPICWLLTREWLLKIYFWLPILLRRRKF